MSKKKDLSALVDYDFHFCTNVDYDDDGYYNCECSGIHRCKTISNARVSEVHIDSVLNNFFVGKDTFSYYCAQRVLTHSPLSNPENYEVSVGRGYYGEEIKGVSFNEDIAPIIQVLTAIQQARTDKDRLFEALKFEYGYVLETLTNLKFSIETIKLSDVFIPQTDHYKRLDKGAVDRYVKNPTEIVCLVTYDNGKMRLVDGYHRYRAAEKRGDKKIKVIVGTCT